MGFFNQCKSSRLGPGIVVRGVWLIYSSLTMSCTVLSPWCPLAGRKPCPGSYFESLIPLNRAQVCLSRKLLSVPGTQGHRPAEKKEVPCKRRARDCWQCGNLGPVLPEQWKNFSLGCTDSYAESTSCVKSFKINSKEE